MITMKRYRWWLAYLPLYFSCCKQAVFTSTARRKKDELAIQNLRRTDAIGLKIMIAAGIFIAFACAVKAIDGSTAGYALVGAILVLAVIRLILFSVMDSKGI